MSLYGRCKHCDKNLSIEENDLFESTCGPNDDRICYKCLYLRLASYKYRFGDRNCSGCGGGGRKAYPTSATWMGGMAGQAITEGICDRCWGSGDENRPFVNLRTVLDKQNSLKREIKELKNEK